MDNVMDSQECAKVLKALADNTRLKILEYLFNGESSVSEISDNIGTDFSQVPHPLGVLRNSGLVIDNKDGKFVMYKLHPIFYKQKNNRKKVLDFSCCRVEFGRLVDMRIKEI